MTTIKFGTDGWRGVIADDFTFENVRRVAQATADYWNGQSPRPDGRGSHEETAGESRLKAAPTRAGEESLDSPRVMVGYDNRFFSEIYARLVGEVLAANGLRVLYPHGSVPTPAVSYAVRDRNLCGAVMITASHNPPSFNGYKIKADFAGPADPEICAAIERGIDQSPVRRVDFEEAVRSGRIEIYDPRPAHVAAVKKIVDLKGIRGAGLKVVVDSMHGSGGHVIEGLLAGRPVGSPIRSFKPFAATATRCSAV